MRAKLSSLGRRLEEIDAMLSSPEVGSDMNKFRDLSRERAEIEPVVQKVREYEKYEKQRAESEELLSDPDMKELAQAEFTECREKLEQLDKDLEIMLLPTDPNDKRNIFLEIRAGTGGDESALLRATCSACICAMPSVRAGKRKLSRRARVILAAIRK